LGFERAFLNSGFSMPFRPVVFSGGEVMSLTRNSGIFSVSVLVVILGILLVAPSAWAQSKFNTLYTFMGGTDGSATNGGLIFDQMGNLYGTTGEGGDLNDGTVFELMPNGDGSWTKIVLHSFNGKDGQGPAGGLIFDQAGNLYGTTSSGGSGGQICQGVGCGTVFQLTPNNDGSWTESVLHSFHGEDGYLPEGGLIFDSEGNLYGTTSEGGDLRRTVVPTAVARSSSLHRTQMGVGRSPSLTRSVGARTAQSPVMN
jgi:uncharacterized repeat protein (TIGR03803 family)